MRIRYRKPSLKTLLGATAVKKKLKRDLGVYQVTRVLNAPKNAKRRTRVTPLKPGPTCLHNCEGRYLAGSPVNR